MSSTLKEIKLNPKNIIIRMPNWLGDVVMATPILADLRNHWPTAKLTAMCQGSVGALIQEDPHIDEILNFKKPSGWIHRMVHGDIIEPLREGHFDLGILLTQSFSSAWLFWRGHVENRLGYASHWRRYLLDYPIELPTSIYNQHLVITYKMLIEPLGIPISPTAPSLYLTAEEKQAMRETFSKYRISPDDIVIGVNPSAAYGSAKCWPLDRFKALTALLIQNPRIKVVIFGDQSTASLVNEICLGFPEQVVNFAGKTTMRELMAAIQSCSIFVTNDSGPMHIASALGLPLLALFGSTSAVTTGPYAGGTVLHKHVACSPCYRRTCPIDFRCMTNIEVNEVYQLILKMIN